MTQSPAPTSHEGSGSMFDGIASRYDLLNRLISFGIDQRWRQAAVAGLSLGKGHRVLDLATGTADLALRAAQIDPTIRVVGLDPSPRMLQVASDKVHRAGLSDRIELLLGDAQKLPFENQSFDAVMIAFGIRNVPDRPRALREIARVIRPSGRVAILELSEPEGKLMGRLARFHIHTLVPYLGGVLSGSREYRYLARSIAAFPKASEFAELLQKSGLRPFEIRPLTFGVCQLYLAIPESPGPAP